MREHEASWAGPDGVPISVGTVPVEDPDQVVFDGVSYSNKAIRKEDIEETRKILKANTMRQTVASKDSGLAKNLEERCFHMEVRFSHIL